MEQAGNSEPTIEARDADHGVRMIRPIPAQIPQLLVIDRRRWRRGIARLETDIFENYAGERLLKKIEVKGAAAVLRFERRHNLYDQQAAPK